MALPFSNPTRLKFLWGLLFVVLMEQCRFTIELVERNLHPNQYARLPFSFSPTPPTVYGINPEAKTAGLVRGDQITMIDGHPMEGSITLHGAFARHKPGDTMVVRTAAGKEAAIQLAVEENTGNYRTNLVLQFTVVPLCLVLGFLVAFLRPGDARSWILLGLMLSFAPIFRWFEFPATQWVVRQMTLVLWTFLQSTWPVWMVLLGIYFPEKVAAGKLTRAIAWALTLPVILHSVLEAALSYGINEDMPLAALLYPIYHSTDKFVSYVALGAIGFYFACLGTRFGSAKTPDARRRLVLLNAGSHVAFLPTLLLVIRGMATGKTTFEGLSGFVIIGSMATLALFPATLAYLVVVHRALDIRMVVRSGIQYALAQRGVAMLQVGVTAAGFYFAVRETGPSQTPIVRMSLIAGAILLGVLLRRVAKKVREWMDRKFFREAYDAEQILNELSDQVRTIVETRPLLETVSRRIAESLHVSQIAMLLRNGGGYEPAFALGYDIPPQAHFPHDAPVATRLQQSRKPQTLYLDDPESWVNRELANHDDRTRLQTLQAQVLLPLSTKNDLVGFISLGAKRSEEPYSGSDLRLLGLVATQSGLALENTQLTAAVASEAAHRESLNHEMQIARDVQQRLYPQRTPSIAGIEVAGACRPAQSVGGDYYDFLELPTGELAFAVGDISGKGVPAAILMAVLQTSIRAQAMSGTADLAVMTRNVNRLVEEASTKSNFATLFYAQYHPQTRLLRYINAGHNPPLLFHTDGICETLRPNGPAIGWSRKAVFKEGHLTLSPGDVLLAFTDGFTEAMNEAREEFGDDRFLETARVAHKLHPEAMIPALMHAVDQFTAGAAQHDDMTIVALRMS